MGINVILDRCQRWRYNRAECALCLKACPVEACIQYSDDKTIHINNETCLTCGICAAECPTNALSIEGLTGSDLWEKLRSEEKNLAFACTLNKNDNDVHVSRQAYKYDFPESASLKMITLPCIGILNESYLASLILSGAEKIYLDLNSCGECRIEQGSRIIEKNISFARTLLSALGHYGRIITDIPKTQTSRDKVKGINVKNISPEKGYSRRELFTSFIGGRSDKFTIVNNELPDNRKTLLEVLAGRERDSFSTINEGEFPVHQLNINENCNLCYSCELFCPTGALKRIENNDEEVRIDFRVSLCMGCYQCRELCHRDALQYTELISLEDLITDKTGTLIRKAKNSCSRCGKLYISEISSDVCLKCMKKERVERDIMSILTMRGGEERGSISV